VHRGALGPAYEIGRTKPLGVWNQSVDLEGTG
jgi:hypothetical protein